MEDEVCRGEEGSRSEAVARSPAPSGAPAGPEVEGPEAVQPARGFASKLFSESGDASFGRVCAGIWVLACIAWNTYRLVALKEHPLPTESESFGEAGVAMALYGSSKTGETFQKIFGRAAR